MIVLILVVNFGMFHDFVLLFFKVFIRVGVYRFRGQGDRVIFVFKGRFCNLLGLFYIGVMILLGFWVCFGLYLKVC